MYVLDVACILFSIPIITLGAEVKSFRVESFTVHEETAVQALMTLAHQMPATVGVSGKMIGGAYDQRISISSNGESVEEILDEICRDDRRFSWRLFPDGNIDVRVGEKTLTIIDLSLANVTLKDVAPRDVSIALLQLPSVKAWARDTGCTIAERITIAGSVRQDSSPKINLTISHDPFWKVLNQLAATNKGHFWSLVQYTDKPCNISFNAPD